LPAPLYAALRADTKVPRVARDDNPKGGLRFSWPPKTRKAQPVGYAFVGRVLDSDNTIIAYRYR